MKLYRTIDGDNEIIIGVENGTFLNWEVVSDDGNCAEIKEKEV